MDTNQLVESLKWALKEVKRFSGPVVHNFGNSQYNCVYCKGDSVGKKSHFAHADSCPWVISLQSLRDLVEGSN